MADPLILRGNLKLGADAGSAVDVSDEVTTFKVITEVETVEIPATLASPKGNRGGAAGYSLEIGYLSSDEADSVYDLLWEATGTASKELYFEGSMRDAVVSDTNPLWSGTLIVVSAEVGGDAEALSTGSSTYPLTGRPTRTSVPPS